MGSSGDDRSARASGPPSAPRSVGRYAVFRELAHGGMASVFYARLIGPSGFSRIVAIKRPHPQLATERDFAAMFIDEARVASRIRHPNVVSTLDVIDAPGELSLVMEYVHGEALSRLWAASRKRGEAIPLPIAAAILLDVLHGLHAAHEAKGEQGEPLGIVHRDVSPQNVLVGSDGITRIVDFGIAKAAGRLHTTRDGAIKGKYAYMAPEQIRGEKVGRTTDVYAASIVLWELLTGKGLFRGENEGEEIYKALEAQVVAPSAVAPGVPEAFDAIVLRGLERDPEKRYPTARAMAIAIEEAAPAVRPSEVAAWVERLAGETLAARAAVIAEIEGSGRDVSAAVAPASEAPTSSLGRAVPIEIESQVSNAGVVAEPAVVSARARVSRRLAWLVGLVLFVAGTYGARSLVRRAPPVAAADAAPPTSPSASEVAKAPPPPPPALSAAAALAPPDAGVPANSTRPQRAPSRGGRRADPRSCDPPYIVDSAGREIFKLQCL